MSEEKKKTRLLPFSLRREREGAGHEGSGDDAELRALLGAWEAPTPTSGSRERLLASFRARVARPPLWKRLLTSTVRVPVPVAACAALALALGTYALATRPAETRSLAAEAKVEATKATPSVRVVEVPVERVVEVPVERVVYVEKYVEKKERAVARRSTARTALARRDAGGGGAEAGGASEASYVTPLDMAEFEPPGALKMRVIRKGRTDEE